MAADLISPHLAPPASQPSADDIGRLKTERASTFSTPSLQAPPSPLAEVRGGGVGESAKLANSSALRSLPDSLISRGGSPHNLSNTTASQLSQVDRDSPDLWLNQSRLGNGKNKNPSEGGELAIHTLNSMDLMDVNRSSSSSGAKETNGETGTGQEFSSSEDIQDLVNGTFSSAISTGSTTYTPDQTHEINPLEPHQHLYIRPQLLDDDSTPSRPRPRAFTLSHSAFGSFGTFPSTARSGPLPAPTLISRVRLFFLQLFANTASAAFLCLIVVWALSSRGYSTILKYIVRGRRTDVRRDWDTDELERRYKNEKVVKDIRYYAQNCGFDVIEQQVETKDGYLLKLFKVVCLREGYKAKTHSDGRGGFPVLIQHGLFQSCGSFITSEERSLAFWLAEHGDYQVYLGNNRGVFDMGHVTLRRSDPRFWDYNIKELALYDLPAMVDHVRRDTGYDKVAFIGHSQGNATMFCSLAQGMVPELGEKLSIFIALAPAVYAGPLTTGFPFGTLKSMKWKTWRKWFGVLDFIPLMRISYDWTPSKPFGMLGYQMFAFLFNWTDTNWLLRRKPKKFRFTPSPVSSASIFWWTGYNGFSTRGCVLDPNVEKWFDQRFPPLSIHHGGKDYLVLVEPLLKRFKEREKDVKLIRVAKMDEGEHCDFFWHIDAVELCFHSFLEDIELTRPRFPEELRRTKEKVWLSVGKS